MRFKVQLEILPNSGEFQTEKIPIRYHAMFLSLLKRGLEATAPAEYERLYSKNQEKLYAQALVFQGAAFKKEEIILNTPVIYWLWSSPKAELAMAFYNAFLHLKDQGAVPLNRELMIRVNNIATIYQNPITAKTADFLLASPLIVRDHNRQTKKDWFLSFEDDNFESVIKRNLKKKLVPVLGDNVQYDIDQMKITPLQMKKTVTKIYEKYCEGSLGSVRLEGASYLLNFVRDSSFSSRSGLFCGFLEEIDRR